jgi:hypothetical protein
VLLADARVIRGGLQLAVIDEAPNQTVASSVYSSDQQYSHARRMAVSFAIARPTKVSFIVGKFSPFDSDRKSVWSLRSITAIRRPTGCQVDDPATYFTPSPVLAP